MNPSDAGPSWKRDKRLRVLNHQLDRLDHWLADLEGRSRRIARRRLANFALLIVAGAVVLLRWGPIPWLIVSAVLLAQFIYWVVRHRKVEQAIRRVSLWRQLKRDQLARMTLDWTNMPASEPIADGFEHPFAIDLNLIGERSVQRVIDISVTREGSALLRRWLLEFQPVPEDVRFRSQAAAELGRMTWLSLRLALYAGAAAGPNTQSGQGRWSSGPLLSWLGTDAGDGPPPAVLFVLLLLAPINIALGAAYFAGALPPYFLVTWFAYAALSAGQLRHVEPVFRNAAQISELLRRLSAIFTDLQDRSFDRAPAISQLTAPLREEGQRPSDMLARTNRLLAAAGLRYNPLVAFLINALFPLDVLVAWRLEVLRSRLRQVMPGWLKAWYCLEAIGSLANFGYLYPEATPARINWDPQPGAKPFAAVGLAHPLVPAAGRVANDFEVSDLGDVILITGSNMAGKSTFLRALGVNLRLALTGAPVLAVDLETVPFRVFASITINDSLIDGISFFYAEVRRLQRLLELLQEAGTPVFYLIDEIFRGTNNRERLIGSRSYVNALEGKHGCGAIATHDLELVALAEGRPSISNFHFRDDVLDGRMVFDYKLHPGPCPTTNALRIMRLAGLPVDENIGAGKAGES